MPPIATTATTAFPSPADLQGAVQGTLLYLGLYAVFLSFQSLSKFVLLRQKRRQQAKKSDDPAPRVSFRATKYYNSQDLLALAGDRSVGNFGEFSLLFLPLYWIHALWVDSSTAWTIAVLYVVGRAPYPVLYLYFPKWIVLSTAPGYLVLAYLIGKILTKVV
jgi:hypothetical protein